MYAVVHVASCNIYPKCSGPVLILCRFSVLLFEVRASLCCQLYMFMAPVFSLCKLFEDNRDGKGQDPSRKKYHEYSLIMVNHQNLERRDKDDLKFG